ncbi:MAG: outer membrane beta-barrel protein [Saprospiraceae bacterium]|nr:outer membrane beta-barrel protein [Saprospiraceae bacterium]
MDKKTTDKAWAVMQELLDREMPVKRRPPFGWWWLGFLLLPIVGYGSWQWLAPGDEPVEQQQIVAVQPLVNLESVTESPVAFPTEQNHQIVSGKISDPPPYIASEKAHKRARNALFYTQHRAVEPILIPDKVQPDLTIFENLPKAESSEQTASPEGPQIPLNLLPITPQPIYLQENRTIFPRSLSIAGTPEPVQKSSDKNWAFGASSGISTEQFNLINGFSTGLIIDRKFSRKWGLRTGLLYNIHTPQEKYRPVASVLSADYQSNVSGAVIVVDINTGQEVLQSGSNNFGDSLAGNVFIPVNRLQRLEVPLTLYWQVAKPLKIIGGLSLTRTLSTKAARQNYSGDYVFKLTDRTAENGASKLSSSELDNWSADAMLGTGWLFGDTFELGISAKVPLNKFPGIAKSNQPSNNAGLLGQPSLGSTRKQNGPVFSLNATLFF